MRSMEAKGMDPIKAAAIVIPLGILLMLGQTPPLAIALVTLLTGAGLLLMPGFLRTVGAGVVGGAIAGILVLGPGMRLAMRVVAIADPIRSPEFTIGGTIFLILFAGVMMGTGLGIATALLARSRRLPPATAVAVVTVLGFGFIVGDRFTR
ncbi:MAG: hypothetical protein ACR2JP_06140 [Acidimicrobiia bacterium]